jgi:hypothetical protein
MEHARKLPWGAAEESSATISTVEVEPLRDTAGGPDTAPDLRTRAQSGRSPGQDRGHSRLDGRDLPSLLHVVQRAAEAIESAEIRAEEAESRAQILAQRLREHMRAAEQHIQAIESRADVAESRLQSAEVRAQTAEARARELEASAQEAAVRAKEAESRAWEAERLLARIYDEVMSKLSGRRASKRAERIAGERVAGKL